MGLAMMHGWMMTLWLFVALAVVAAVVAAAVVAVRHFGTDTRSRGAIELLEERYASGEIDEEDYRERRQVLHG